ncbi:epoxide hydrolase family protein [Streptomyces antimycoticus]|uniref:Epoxide hydrolase n=1 Tax=Streptomyces antimycoticus TaxID=68175 RepID=A0ABD5J877_9ACTN|nr:MULTISPECIES: epoxide hydrolase [Streptomyces]MEE4584548.1 epoxide hydrolase [Streptomyces sp. DSM 41602]RSS44038.1 epoxide hydrolase [Streptomyces sp. WAC05858]WTA79847.1 alpha/beta fold hydrolase [Streptomyces antimycoticus]
MIPVRQSRAFPWPWAGPSVRGVPTYPAGAVTPDIEPFTISVPDADLDDLRSRLDRVRLPESETVADASQGVPLDQMRALLAALRDVDWRAREKTWNAIGHFRTVIDGLELAFWHVRSPEPAAMPLLLTHGWPGSILEFEQVIGPLTDPAGHGGDRADAFDVVVPSLPGFGFSGRPAETGWNPARTADAWATLMSRLGYDRFAAHGGDWGAFISTELARRFPSRVIGLHLTMPVASPLPQDRDTATPAEARMIERRDLHLADGYGFGIQMGTRPQTLGYALVDSPAGLAAWLGEKFAAYADTRAEAGGGVSLDRQAEGIALYWLTGTGASTSRWYWEALRWTPRSAEEENARPVTVPTACSLFPAEPWPTARRWAERRYTDLRFWHAWDRGGHFPGLEHPDVLVEEVRAAFRGLR